MSKLLILFAMASFYSASSQQKDVFDINRHLQNLQNKKLSLGNILKSTKLDTFYINKDNEKPLATLSHILPNGDKVYILSGDNMPCVVPGSNQYIAWNSANPKIYYSSPYFKNEFPGSIPNMEKPHIIIPAK